MNDMSSRIAADAGGRGARFTTAEFARMCELGAFDDMKVELVDGELERLIKPFANHAHWQALVLIRLASLCSHERLVGEAGIDMGDATVLGCDAALLYGPAPLRWLRPDEVLLVIEVSGTTLARDLGLKLRRYAAAGVPHYWVVDGSGEVVHVFTEPQDGAYRQHAVVRFIEPLSVPGTDATITLA